MSNLAAAKHLSANFKAMDKDTTIISNLRIFFSKSEENHANFNSKAFPVGESILSLDHSSMIS